MPIYNFECPQCHNRQERICKFEHISKCFCFKCGYTLKLLPSKLNFNFKVPGFSVTTSSSSEAVAEEFDYMGNQKG